MEVTNVVVMLWVSLKDSRNTLPEESVSQGSGGLVTWLVRDILEWRPLDQQIGQNRRRM